MSTLVMTVGTGRTRRDIAEALLFSVHQHKPEKVVFLCSAKTVEQTLPHLEKPMKQKKIPYEVFSTNHEDHVQLLYQEYLDILSRYSGITADFTSGTKAMSAALFAAAIAVQADRVSYICGPRDDTGRAVQSTDVISFPPDLVVAQQQLSRAAMLFKNLDFHAAWTLADRYRKTLPREHPLGYRAKALYLIGQAYDYWEQFRWDQAAHLLEKAANPREGLTGIDRNQLLDNASFLHTLVADSWADERLVELAANARRRLEQGRYDDALARLYRACEYLVQIRLFNRFELDTAAIQIERLNTLDISEKCRRRLLARVGENQKSITLGLKDAIGLLAELKDEVGRVLFEKYWGRPFRKGLLPNPQTHHGPLQNFLTRRNRSFLAHGANPVDKKTVCSMLTMYEELLKQSLTSERVDQLTRKARFIEV